MAGWRSIPLRLGLLLLPAAIYVTGTVETAVRSGGAWPADIAAFTSMAIVALAPIVAALVLAKVAPGYDLVLFATAMALAAIGTTALHAFSARGGDAGAFYATLLDRHQWFVAGGCVALVGGAWSARFLDRIRPYPYSLAFVALLLTAVTVVLGNVVNGARLWLQIGPVRFQPSEVARIFLAGFVAIYLYERRHLVADSWRIGRLALPPAPYLVPLAAASLAAVGVLALQNDLGMAALMSVAVVVMVVSVLQSRTSALLAAVVLVLSGATAVAMAPRLRDRIAGWLDPWQSPIGTGFQFLQADFAVAAGGVAGNGAIDSATRVPEVHTDFILIGIANLYGLLGASAVIALSAVLVLRCVENAMRSGESFETYFGLALAILLGIQVILIVGGSLRVLPLTGLTLPLVSYGGTSLLMTCFALGIVLGIGARRGEPRIIPWSERL